MKNLSTYAIIFLLVCLVVSIMTCNSERKSSNRIATQLQDSTTYWRDRYGTEHARNTVVEGKYSELQGDYKTMLDTASKRAGVDRRKIEELTKVNMQLKGQFVVKVQHDTVNNTIYYTYGDSDYHQETTISNDSAHTTYGANIEANMTVFSDRKWFGGSLTHYADVYSTNPNIKITNLQHVQVVKEKPKVLAKVAFFMLGVLGGILIMK